MGEENTKMEEINQTTKQIDKPLGDTGKELEDTKAYLNIVLSELEETKARIPVATKRKKNGWKAFAMIEFVVVLAGCAVLTFYHMNQNTTPVMKNESHQVEDTLDPKTGITQINTIKKINDLSTLVTQFQPREDGMQAYVETLFGYEYLAFKNEDITVYYRNEFLKNGDSGRQLIMIDNGKRLCEYTWDFDMSFGLEQLCPYYGKLLGVEGKQLVFPVYENGDLLQLPQKIHVVQVDNLWEYGSLDVPQKMNEILAATYEEVGTKHAESDMRLKLVFGLATYTYAIDKDAYVDAVYYDEEILKYQEHSQMVIEEGQILIKAIPYLSNEKYLGELSAVLTILDNQVTFDKTSFAAYVLANQEDEENEGVILPSSHIYSEDRIKLWGKNGENFILELSDQLERNSVTQENLVKDENGKYMYQSEDISSVPGIDVSKFQGEIDWKQVKESGVEFAIIRLGFRGFGEGTLEIDPYFEKNIQGATDAGIKVGVYFFSQAVNVTEAQEEAVFVLEKIKDYEITYPVIIDTEHVANRNARANNLSRQTRTDIAKSFCDTVKTAGYQPMIYANTKWMIMGIDLEQLMDYDLWFAYYGDNLTFPYQFDMYQYSDKGQVPGIKGNVDLNLSLIDYSVNQEIAHTP